MCLGRTHLLGGVALGLGAADAVGGQGLARVLAGAAVAGGAALLNDLDTPSSTASHALGRATGWLASGVRWLAEAAFTVTATPVDHRYASPTHRGLTHTLVFAAAVGTLAWQLARLGPVGVGVVAIVTAVPALRVVGHGRLRGMSLILAALAVAALVAVAAPSAVSVGVAVGAGLLSHDLLDGCTTMGVPLLWPLKLRGMRWRRVGLPRILRFHTGGPVEPWALGALAVGCVALTPPALELIKLAVYKQP